MLGYGAYVVFFEFCKKAFPEISDQAVARMVAGIDVIMYRPDDELRRLARLAVDCRRRRPVHRGLLAGRRAAAALAERGEAGQRWLDGFEEARDPWFHVSTGDGFYHHHRSWNDNLTVPFAALPRYVRMVREGEAIDRPTEALREERERIVAEYRGLLPGDDERAAFDQMLGPGPGGLPLRGGPQVLLRALVHDQVLRQDPRVRRAAGPVGSARRGRGRLPVAPHRGRPGAGRREPGLGGRRDAAGRGALRADHRRAQADARGDARTGRRRRRSARCPRRSTTRPCGCCGASPRRRWPPGRRPQSGERRCPSSTATRPRQGVVEGTARVLRSVNDIGQIRDGEILVCPVTAPSWAPVFGKIKAAVSDIGGTMSHAAIVAREYGMPAVVGTGHATKRITDRPAAPRRRRPRRRHDPGLTMPMTAPERSPEWSVPATTSAHIRYWHLTGAAVSEQRQAGPRARPGRSRRPAAGRREGRQPGRADPGRDPGAGRATW